METKKKYYNFAGMMVTMDDGTDLVYFANDHLSSASLVMDDAGGLSLLLAMKNLRKGVFIFAVARNKKIYKFVICQLAEIVH